MTGRASRGDGLHGPEAVVRAPVAGRPRLAGWLFPPEPRHIPGERWANIVLRAAHLVGVAGMASGFLFEIEKAAWLAYWHLTAASGVAMVLLYLACSGWWVAQLKGLSMVLKLIPLWAALHWPVVQTELFLSVVVLSALVAHAPGPVRNWSPLDRWRRRVGFAGDDRNR